jgi:LPS sulfotransferase NodH
MNPIEKCLVERRVNLPSEPVTFFSHITEMGITKPYIIVMTGRCGSTWLASVLEQIGGFGNPIEMFSEEGLPYYWCYERPQDFSEVFLGIISKFKSEECFGFKTDPVRLFWLQRLVDIPRTFVNASWIDMRRWNLVKQAFSFVIAKKTKLWHLYESDQNRGNVSTREPVEIHDIEVWREIVWIVTQEQRMNKFYEEYEITPLRIWYEEIFDSRLQLVARVLKHINKDYKVKCTEALMGVSGKTAKLDKSSYTQRELQFVIDYANELNEIYMSRSLVNVSELFERIVTA